LSESLTAMLRIGETVSGETVSGETVSGETVSGVAVSGTSFDRAPSPPHATRTDAVDAEAKRPFQANRARETDGKSDRSLTEVMNIIPRQFAHIAR